MKKSMIERYAFGNKFQRGKATRAYQDWQFDSRNISLLHTCIVIIRIVKYTKGICKNCEIRMKKGWIDKSLRTRQFLAEFFLHWNNYALQTVPFICRWSFPIFVCSIYPGKRSRLCSWYIYVWCFLQSRWIMMLQLPLDTLFFFSNYTTLRSHCDWFSYFYFFYACYLIVIDILKLIRPNERINSDIKDGNTGSFKVPIKQTNVFFVKYNCFTTTINLIILKLNWN